MVTKRLHGVLPWMMMKLTKILNYLGAPEDGKKKVPSSGKSMAEEGKEKSSSSNCCTKEVKNNLPSSEKATTETMYEKLEQAYASMSKPTHNITSENQGLTVSTHPGKSAGEHAMTEDWKWDKGASVKEYIRSKLDPGEDNRAVSQVISDAINPKKTPGDKGVMEKVKETVPSLLQEEEPAQLPH
ncbi:hypothetical protein Ancab_011591 [Ancistrocladus abbreviatus]